MTKPSSSLRGQLLLDGGQLRGSYFNRAVVLVCQHDPDGAFGLVLNRPSEQTVGSALAAELPTALQQHRIFLGGPVQPTALSFLHTDTFLPEASVLPDLNLGHSIEALTELGGSYSTSQKVRLFAGYAGWSPGQLDEELKRGAWLTHPASLKLIFDAEPKTLWQQVLQEKGWQYRLLADAPDDLSAN